ncbi:MAG: hypothetical protein ACW99F_06820 [Candidatus Hodarchaeales archaeon]|jgi:tRNA (guanine26-N2/guanine27-N2)-dimethyltransferase
MNLSKIREGGREYFVPKPIVKDEAPRRTDEAFFNPHQDLNRDFSVLLIRAYSQIHKKQEMRICEPFGGVGIRTCRYVNETPTTRVYYNDINPTAINIAKLNRGELPQDLQERIIFHHKDVTDFLNLLYSEKEIMDVIDIDPYGTPIPYVHNSLKLVTNQGLIGLTATDLASLTGIYPEAMYAKYGVGLFESRIGNIHELAIRILITGIQRIGLIQNQSLIPIFSLYYRHYIRTFLLRKRGVEEVVKKTGYLCKCKACKSVFQIRKLSKNIYCTNCESIQFNRIGPIFLGLIHQKKYLEKMKEDLHSTTFTRHKSVSKILDAIIGESELDLPWSYDIPRLAKETKSPIPNLDLIIQKLKEIGFNSKKTHFSGMCIKTEAKISYIENILEESRKDNGN